MITVEKHGIILAPTTHEFENGGVFNPAIYQEGDQVHILYRAVEDGNYSTLGYARTDGPVKIAERYTKPLVTRELDIEKHGVEDARIVKIEDLYYLTYTAYDGINAIGAIAVSPDLKHFDKKGIVTPQVNYHQYERFVKSSKNLNPKYHHYYKLFEEIGLIAESDQKRLLRDKDVVLFPKKIGGKFAMLHRIWPGIQIVYFNDWSELTEGFWEDYLKNLHEHIILDSKYDFEINYIGAGCPPIETEDGWLLIYHGVQEMHQGKVYHTGAVLLHRENPSLEIGRLNSPLISPTKKWEKEGVVSNVVFPTGTALFGNDLYIYYGAADMYVAVASVKLDELLHELKKEP